MNISAVNSASPTLNNMLSPQVNGVRQGPEQQPSTVVSLSSQGQSLSQTDAPAQVSQQTVTGNKEIKEPPGIQFMKGESKGGKVNTFA